MEEKQCRICGKSFIPIQNGGSRQYCFECVPLTNDIKQRTAYKRIAFKKEGVRLLGGKCMKCGDTRHYVLNFHHLNKTTKNETPASLLSDSKFEDFLQEIDKCILLCSNCHQEFHFLEHYQNLTIDQYVDLTQDYKQNDIINRNQTFIKHYCKTCGKELKNQTTSGLCNECVRQASRKTDRPEPLVLAQEICQ